MTHNTIVATDNGFRFLLASNTLLTPTHRPELQRVIQNAYENGDISSEEYEQLSRIYFSPVEDGDGYYVGYVVDGQLITENDIQVATVDSVPQQVDSDSYLHPALEPTDPIQITAPEESDIRGSGEVKYDDIEHLREIQTQIENNKIVWNKAKHGDSSTLEYKVPKTYSESRQMIDDNQMYQQKLEQLWGALTDITYVAVISVKVGHQTDALAWDIHPYEMALVDVTEHYQDESVCKRCGAIGDDDFVTPTETEHTYKMCTVCQNRL